MSLLPVARLRVLARLVVLVVPLSCGGDLDEAPPPKPEAEGDLAMVSFEAMAYFDASASNARIIERIRREKESVVVALRRQQVSINPKKQVDVELRRVIREPVTVVDKAAEGRLDKTAEGRRQALRVRYWFVGFGAVLPEMLQLEDVPFGILHTDDDAKAPTLAPCLLEPAEDRPMWQRFDPTRAACKAAIEIEQRSIDAARRALGARENEIVPAEFDRLYVPISLHMTSRTTRARRVVDAGADVELVVAPRGKEPEGIDPPSAGSDGPGTVSFLEKLRERAQAEAEASDEGEESNPTKVRPPTFVTPAVRSGEGVESGSPFIFNEPNFALLWLVGLVIVSLVTSEYIRRKRRQTHRPTVRRRRR